MSRKNQTRATRESEEADEPLLESEHTSKTDGRVLFSLDDDDDQDEDTPLARYADERRTPGRELSGDEGGRYSIGPPLRSTIQSREAGKLVTLTCVFHQIPQTPPVKNSN